jgi:hypothetical protein
MTQIVFFLKGFNGVHGKIANQQNGIKITSKKKK